MARSKVKQSKKRTLPITPEVLKVLDHRKQEFIKKFGREPGPNDPIFFDPDKDTPTLLSNKKIKDDWDKACETALRVGIDPAIVYAMAKTERIVSTTNKKLLEPEEIEEWNDAIEQFQAYTTKKLAKTMTWPEIKEMVEASRAAEERDTPERLMEIAMYALQACVDNEMVHVQEAFTGGPDGVLGLFTCYVTCPDPVALEIQEGVRKLVEEILRKHGLEAATPPRVN